MASRIWIAAAACAALALDAGTAAAASKNNAPELAKCEESLGTIALVDGDLAGWTDYGLGSPRELVNSLAVESGCFTPHTASSGPARFLMTAVAGNQEEVDQSVAVAKGAATEALVRSGVAGRMLGRVPFAGSALGMFGGLGGKKKIVAAGLRVVSPLDGQAIAAGTGSVKKSSITFGGSGGFGWANSAAAASGYQNSADGRMLTEAFIIAFNQLVAQKVVLAAAPAAAAPTAPTLAAVVAVDTYLRAGPASDAAQVRSLRAETELMPTGKREGLFVEVADSFGTSGWVSVEDLK